MTRTNLLAILFVSVLLPACVTAPEPIPEPEPEPVVIDTAPVQTCVSINDLRRVEVPAVTKKVIAITEIENPPYEPIQRREEQTRVVTPAYVYYVDDAGMEVTEFCESGL